MFLLIHCSTFPVTSQGKTMVSYYLFYKKKEKEKIIKKKIIIGTIILINHRKVICHINLHLYGADANNFTSIVQKAFGERGVKLSQSKSKSKIEKLL